MTQKELFELRAARFDEGRCPVCGEVAEFRCTGTKTESGCKIRSMNCPLCKSTFRAHVKTEITFCKVTREGGATPKELFELRAARFDAGRSFGDMRA